MGTLVLAGRATAPTPETEISRIVRAGAIFVILDAGAQDSLRMTVPYRRNRFVDPPRSANDQSRRFCRILVYEGAWRVPREAFNRFHSGMYVVRTAARGGFKLWEGTKQNVHAAKYLAQSGRKVKRDRAIYLND